MTLMTSTSDALIDIIPFDNPKHPRLPSNTFPKGGRAGALTQAARLAWITGKYVYKHHKRWLAGGLALSVSSSVLFNRNGQNVPTRKSNPFGKTYNRFGRSTYRRYNKYNTNKHRCKCAKRRFRPSRNRYR